VPNTRYIFNSVLVTGATALGILVVQSMAAYPLARHHRAPGRRRRRGPILFLTTAAFMFATQVTTIPRLLVVNGLRLTDTYSGLILPTLAQPSIVFLLVSLMAHMRESLLGAARTDGAGGGPASVSGS
jgi:ABC-type glycerol-3-phosphate transport system permease component